MVKATVREWNNMATVKYQLEFFKLTKKMCEECPRVYKLALISVRLNELQEKGAYAIKINKPKSSGTKISFKIVKDADEFQKELDRIIEDGSALGIQFHLLEKKRRCET